MVQIKIGSRRHQSLQFVLHVDKILAIFFYFQYHIGQATFTNRIYVFECHLSGVKTVPAWSKMQNRQILYHNSLGTLKMYVKASNS